MEILTFPIGLVIGLFPVVVDLGGYSGNARLRLDGAPVCTVSVNAPSCMIDLGPTPRIHALDLERLDKNGAVVETIRRWVNRPGEEAKLRAVGSCDEKRRACDFQIQWAHPDKLDPSSLTVALDGKTLSTGTAPRVHLEFPGKSPPQILTVEAVFPDDSRASFSQVLNGSYPQEAEASLQSVALEIGPGQTDADLDARLRKAGWKLRTVEKGESEILFVIEPHAFQSGIPGPRRFLFESLAKFGPVRLLVADESLSLVKVVANRSPVAARAVSMDVAFQPEWISALLQVSRRASVARFRVADAVAAAGYRLGSVPRRRLVILVLGDEGLAAAHPDDSTLTAEMAQAYLRQVQVPLVVWRLAPRAASEWPAGPAIEKTGLADALAAAHAQLKRQRTAWLEGSIDWSDFSPTLPKGVSIAGQGPGEKEEAAASARSAPASSEGVQAPFRDVYAVASGGDGESLFAATDQGLFSKSDAAPTWRRVAAGIPGPMFSVAIGGKNRSEALAGGSGALLRSLSGGESWASQPVPAVLALAVDPTEASIVYAGMRGRVLKSADGGLTWADSSTGIARNFTSALAVDPKERSTVFAGTIGGGVFRSTNGGKSWRLSGDELRATAVRCLAVDPERDQNILAGTDGGVFFSDNGGRTWQTSYGLPRAVVYALALSPGKPSRAFAGTASGLFRSEDGGRTWNRSAGPAAEASITSLCFQREQLIAGTLGGGVLAELPEARP